MAVYIGVIIAVTALTSCVGFFIFKRVGIHAKSLIISIAALNILFCAIFPLLFAFISGGAGASDGSPARGLPVVFFVLVILTLIYIAFIIWRVALRSPGFLLNMPIPTPDSAETGGEAVLAPNNAEDASIMTGNEKDIIDTALNIDKMGIITASQIDADNYDVNALLNRAFDSLGGGRLDEAAECFYGAMEKHPPLNLEIQIAIQLCMVYIELGQAELAFDILVGYNDQYRNRLSEEDKSILETGISMIESMATGIGGNGYEKD